jgi:hypothetical protein
MDVRLHGGIQSQSGVNRKARKKSPLFEIARLLVPSGSAYQRHRKPESDSQFYAQFRAVTHSRRNAISVDNNFGRNTRLVTSPVARREQG